MDFLNNFFGTAISIVKTASIFDIVDILLVAFIIYKCIKLVKETRAEQLLKGILLFVVAYYLSSVLNLKTMSFILNSIIQFGVIALIVVFQPELRSALEHLGRSSVGGFRLFQPNDDSEKARRTENAINEVCEACRSLQKNRIGALVLFEHMTRLGEIVSTGTVVNADISAELVCNIFYPKAALHDGAMIIRDGRVYAAGCFLPLSQNQSISRELGTRHRAALGISESCDVVVVVVSEETGVISLVRGGVIKRNLSVDTLRAALDKALLPENTGDKKPGFKVFSK